MVETIDLLEMNGKIEPRVEKGAELLFDMECAGETGVEYEKWVRKFSDLVFAYNAICLLILGGETEIPA